MNTSSISGETGCARRAPFQNLSQGPWLWAGDVPTLSLNLLLICGTTELVND